MKTTMVFQGSKKELDRLCDRMQWGRQERNNRFGWAWTNVFNTREFGSDSVERIGFIHPGTRETPCRLEIEVKTIDHASRMATEALVSGALELLS